MSWTEIKDRFNHLMASAMGCANFLREHYPNAECLQDFDRAYLAFMKKPACRTASHAVERRIEIKPGAVDLGSFNNLQANLGTEGRRGRSKDAARR